MITKEGFELWRERGDGTPLIIRGEARLPEQPRGTVVICHGFKGFAHFSFFPYVATQLAEAGLRAITFDLSGSGIGKDRENFTSPETFTHNTFSQELDDIEAVVAEARVHRWIDSDGYGLFGHSRGGGMAILHAARDEKVKALVTWAAISHTSRWDSATVEKWKESGFTDIENARTKQTIPLSTDILDDLEEHGDTLDIPRAASSIKVPWLIVHGSQDETVNVSEGERLSDLSKGVSTLRLIDTNHSFGGKHPLTEITPTLESVTRETVDFFVANLIHSAV